LLGDHASATALPAAFAPWIRITRSAQAAHRSVRKAIKHAVTSSPRWSEQAAIAQGTAIGPPPVDSRPLAPVLSPGIEASVKAAPPSSFATGYATQHPQRRAKYSKRRAIIGGERGIRTLEGLLTLTPLAGVRLRPLGHLSVRLEIDPLSGSCVQIAPPCARQGGHDT